MRTRLLGLPLAGLLLVGGAATALAQTGAGSTVVGAAAGATTLLGEDRSGTLVITDMTPTQRVRLRVGLRWEFSARSGAAADACNASTARTGAGISAAPTRISANAARRTPMTRALSPSRSPNTASPARIVDRFAATEVTAITATPSPI